MAERELGVVKWFSDQKIFGFIAPDNAEKDVFVHYSQIKVEGYKTLRQGQRVEFEIVEGDKGPMAQNVVPID